jgi:hypothetical protein
MLCQENMPFSLCSSIFFLIALSLESVPLVLGILFMTFLSSVQSYTIQCSDDYDDETRTKTKETNKHKLAIKQKYKCANFITPFGDCKCLLEDGVFDEAGYRLLDNKVYCPMCHSTLRKNKPKEP